MLSSVFGGKNSNEKIGRLFFNISVIFIIGIIPLAS